MSVNLAVQADRRARKAMEAQNRRKKWNSDSKLIRVKNSKYTDVSNYNFGQYKQMYKEVLGGKKSSGSGGGKLSPSPIHKMQMLKKAVNGASAEYDNFKANEQAQYANLSKNELMKLLSQSLQRQSKGGH